MGSMGTTTLPQPHPHPESLHLTEDLPNSTTNLPKPHHLPPHHLPPHNQNGRLRQLQLLLLELLLCSGLLHLRQINQSFTNRPSVTSPASTTMLPHHLAFTILLFTRETCVNENFFGGVARHHGLQGWIEGRLDEDTRLKMGGQRT